MKNYQSQKFAKIIFIILVVSLYSPGILKNDEDNGTM